MIDILLVFPLELVSKELNHLAAILHVYARGLNFIQVKYTRLLIDCESAAIV